MKIDATWLLAFQINKAERLPKPEWQISYGEIAGLCAFAAMLTFVLGYWLGFHHGRPL